MKGRVYRVVNGTLSYNRIDKDASVLTGVSEKFFGPLSSHLLNLFSLPVLFILSISAEPSGSPRNQKSGNTFAFSIYSFANLIIEYCLVHDINNIIVFFKFVGLGNQLLYNILFFFYLLICSLDNWITLLIILLLPPQLVFI